MKKTSEFIVMEITEEEMAMIIAKRNEAEKEAKRMNYVKELNTILHKLNADGFTLSTGGGSKIKNFTSWGDVKGEWIKVNW